MIGYYISIALGWLIALAPMWALYVFGDFMYFMMRYVVGYRKKVIMDNLRLAFPEKEEAELEKIRADFYRNFSDLIVETFKSLNVSERMMRKRFTLEKREVLERLEEKGKGVMLVMGHYTNFEWTAMTLPLLVPHKSYAVYHPLGNKRFSQKIVQIREQFGLKLFPMEETYPFMLNNPAKAPLYVFMADQSPHSGKIKYRAPFFGVKTPVHLGVENLAKKCDLAVVFIDIQRVKRGHYTITPHLLFENPTQTAPYEITDAHVAFLEQIIRKKPADWLWSHRRWKYA